LQLALYLRTRLFLVCLRRPVVNCPAKHPGDCPGDPNQLVLQLPEVHSAEDTALGSGNILPTARASSSLTAMTLQGMTCSCCLDP